MIYLTNINLSQNELQNAIIQPLAVAPSNPKLGQIYTDSTDSKIKWYNGTSWATIGVVVESSEANGHIKVDGVDMKVYSLPKATAEALGGIRLGTGLKATDNGIVSVDVVNNLTSTDTDKPLSAAMGKSLKESINKITTDIGDMGGGDMMKATYDSNNSGIVDDSEKLGGQLPDYYAKAEDVKDIAGASLGTATITAGQTNTTVSTSKSIISYSAIDASTGEQINIDMTKGTGSYTFTITAAYKNSININYLLK